MIAIATPSLLATSETFITRHIRDLAPGRTVVVCFDDANASELDCPVHSAATPDRSSLPWPVRMGVALGCVLRYGYSSPLARQSREELVRFLVGHQVTTVLAEYGPTACIIRSACKAAGVRLFVHFHGCDASRLLRQWWTRYAYRRLLADADGLICPSQFLAEKLQAIGLPQERIHVVPCGVDIHEFSPNEAERDRNLVLAVGRFVEKKAPQHTVAAFARAARQVPDAKLEMIGEGPLLNKCRALADQAGLDGSASFRGAQDHSVVKQEMARAAVFVQHSVTAADGDTEGLPVAILEAMSSGLPVVATRHAGIPEAVDDGRTGLLVEEHDEAGMADALVRLLMNPEEAKAMGAAGRQRAVRLFSSEQQLARLRNSLSIDRW